MNKTEARQVAYILTTADGGCGDCFDALSKQMALVFPAFNWWLLGKEAEAAAKERLDALEADDER